MNIKATLLASVLSMPLVVGAALAADTGNQSLVTAVKQGRQADVQSILNSAAKDELVATQGGAALIWAASHNDKGMVDLLLKAGANPKAVNDHPAPPVSQRNGWAKRIWPMSIVATDPSSSRRPVWYRWSAIPR